MRLTRVQSVFEALEEDDLLFRCGFAEGDDADFIYSLGVYDRNNNAVQKSEGHESLLLVLEAVVLIGEGWTFKHSLCIDKIQAVSLQIGLSLVFHPRRSAYT
jgi:hypothetical protein